MNKKKVLLIRLDKIGDLVCTIPADQVLDENEYDITWIIQKGMGSVADLGLKKRKYFELDKTNIQNSKLELKKIIQNLKPETAISFQCPWWVNFELFKAQVPVRAGVKSQWHSFLFLNHALRQKRSTSEKHELEYNLDIVNSVFKLKSTKQFHYFEIAQPTNTDILNKYSLAAGKYVVVHPGMMGSALNWPQKNYITYIHQLIKNNKHVVITRTNSDEIYLTDIKTEFLNHTSVTWLQSKLNMPELVTVLTHSEFVLAPSTGVAHLAASASAKVKVLFSAIAVHHPRRWAPRGPNVQIHMLDTITLDAKVSTEF